MNLLMLYNQDVAPGLHIRRSDALPGPRVSSRCGKTQGSSEHDLQVQGHILHPRALHHRGLLLSSAGGYSDHHASE